MFSTKTAELSMGHIFMQMVHQQVVSLCTIGSFLPVRFWNSENWVVKRHIINGLPNAAWAPKPELWLFLPPLCSGRLAPACPLWLQEWAEGRVRTRCQQMERWGHLPELPHLLLAQEQPLWFGSFNSSFNWGGGSGFRRGRPGYWWSFLADVLLLFLTGPFVSLLFSLIHSFSLPFFLGKKLLLLDAFGVSSSQQWREDTHHQLSLTHGV